MAAIDQSKIRNFCIVAHIDHGKSTLADRIIETFTKEAIVERFSDNARKHARVNHDAEQNYYRLIRIYREMLS